MTDPAGVKGTNEMNPRHEPIINGVDFRGPFPPAEAPKSISTANMTTCDQAIDNRHTISSAQRVSIISSVILLSSSRAPIHFMNVRLAICGTAEPSNSTSTNIHRIFDGDDDTEQTPD